MPTRGQCCGAEKGGHSPTQQLGEDREPSAEPCLTGELAGWSVEEATVAQQEESSREPPSLGLHVDAVSARPEVTGD